MNPFRRPAAAVRPTGPTYCPPAPSSQPPSSQPRPPYQPLHPHPHQQPHQQAPQHPSLYQYPAYTPLGMPSSTATISRLHARTPEPEESQPLESQSQSQYSSAQPFRPQSSLGSVVSASASAASRVPDSHRSGMSNMLVPPTPTSTGAAGSAPGGPHRPSPHMYQAQQQPMQTQGQGQGGPQKQLMSEKLMAAVNQLETRVMGMQTEMRNLRDLTHEVRTCMQAVPTREEVKEELRDILSPALYEFVTNITNGVKDTIAPLSEQTASLAAEKIRALPMSMQMPAASYRDRSTNALMEHLVKALAPVGDLKDAIKDLDGLPDALRQVTIFHRSMELLHTKVNKLSESQDVERQVAPLVQRRLETDAGPEILRVLKNVEERMDEMEARLEAQTKSEALLKKMAEDMAFLCTTFANPNPHPTPPDASRASSQLHQFADVALMDGTGRGSSTRHATPPPIPHPPRHAYMPPTNAQPPMPPAFVHRPPSASINRSFTPAYHTRRAPHRPQPQPQYHSETLLEFDGYPQKEEQPDPETLYQFGPTDVIEIEDSAGSLVSQARSQTPTTSPEPVRPKTQCTYQRKKGDALPTPQSASSSNSNNVFAPVMPTNTPALRSRKRKAPTSSEGDSNLAKSATPATPTDEDVKPPPKKRTAAPKKRATQPKAAPAKAAPAKAAPAKKAHAKKAPAKKPAAKKTGSKKAPPSRAETPVPREVIELLGDDILNSISVDTPDLGRTRSATRLSRETSTGTPKIPGAIAEGSQEEDEEEDKEIDITDGDALIGLDWD